MRYFSSGPFPMGRGGEGEKGMGKRGWGRIEQGGGGNTELKAQGVPRAWI